MSGDATELPTAERIQELREKGIISYSARSTALVVLLILIAVYSREIAVSSKFKSLFVQIETVKNIAQVKELLQGVLVQLFIVPSCAALMGVFIWGMIQSKFLFKMGLFSIDFSRFATQGRFSVGAILRALVGGVSVLVIALLVMLLVWRSVGVDILQMLRERPQSAGSNLFARITQGNPLTIIALGFLALALLIVEKVRFALSHRMTRKEVQAEQ